MNKVLSGIQDQTCIAGNHYAGEICNYRGISTASSPYQTNPS